jgi:hypothetical protein
MDQDKSSVFGKKKTMGSVKELSVMSEPWVVKSLEVLKKKEAAKLEGKTGNLNPKES